MKYFIYISEAKVDMLYSQIPLSITRKILSEIQIGIPPFTVTFKDKSNEKTEQDNVYLKLSVVQRYIEDHYSLTNAMGKGPYFRDTIAVKWAEMGDGLVYFTHNSPNLVIGLGGSSVHLIGNSGAGKSELEPARSSNDARILQGLAKLIHKRKTHVSLPNDIFLEELLTQNDLNYALSAVEMAGEYISGVEHNVEVVARMLAHYTKQSRGRQRRIVLGTPLYVAYSDE